MLFAAQAPTSVGSLGGVVANAAWKTKPSWYVVATEDRAISPGLERTMAERMNAGTISIDASHVAMLSHSQEGTALIIEAAGRQQPLHE